MSKLSIQVAVVFFAMVTCVAAWAQTSSLYVVAVKRQPRVDGEQIEARRTISPAVAEASFVAVGQPMLRKFARYDLVTIIVRETITSDAESTLDTEKSFSKKGKISAIPRFRLEDFLNLQVKQSGLSGGQPEINVTFDSDFKGEGKHEQRNTFTARITARIIDIRPNGNLVLEARNKIDTDGEVMIMVLTGTCRPKDVSTDNSVLSTQLYGLSIVKEHRGELRRASKKGFLTKIFDTIFNF